MAFVNGDLSLVDWVVLCSAMPLIRGMRTSGEARETGAPLIVEGGAATEKRGLAKNNVSLRRAKIHTCTYLHVRYSNTGRERHICSIYDNTQNSHTQIVLDTSEIEKHKKKMFQVWNI